MGGLTLLTEIVSPNPRGQTEKEANSCVSVVVDTSCLVCGLGDHDTSI